jgi:hypothetical protein
MIWTNDATLTVPAPNRPTHRELHIELAHATMPQNAMVPTVLDNRSIEWVSVGNRTIHCLVTDTAGDAGVNRGLDMSTFQSDVGVGPTRAAPSPLAVGHASQIPPSELPSEHQVAMYSVDATPSSERSKHPTRPASPAARASAG